MAYISPKTDVVLYGVELSFGVQATPTRVLGMIETPDGFTAPTYETGTDVGHQLSSTAPAYYKQDAYRYKGGSIKLKCQRVEFLEYIIGNSTDAAAGSAYTHTIDPDDVVPSLTIARCRKDNTSAAAVVGRDLYVGCLIKSVKFEAKKGEVLMATIEFDCQKVVSDTTTLAVATQSGENPILFKGSSLTVGGATLGTMTDFVWTFERTIRSTELLNSLIPANMSTDEWKVTSSVTYAYTSQTEVGYVHGSILGTQDAEGTSRVVNFAITNGLTLANLRSLQLNGASSRMKTFAFQGFGDHALAKLDIVYLTCQVIATDATADWAV
jgi:hypothetical protein